MDLSLLETLRQKIATGTDFAKVFEYFFDHFGENPDFFDFGAPSENKMLVSLLGQVGGALFKTERVTLNNMRLVEIKEHNFIHGALTINGALSSVIYCTDLQKGMLSVHRQNNNGRTDFIRFSADMLPPNLRDEISKFKH